MRTLVVFSIFYVAAIGGVKAVPADRWPQIAQAIKPEISLRLLPPASPHHDHYHHHQSQSTSTTQTPVTPSIATNKPTAEITKYIYENYPDGGYRFLYETSDGQSREETGYFHHDPKLGKILQVRGSYGYTGDDNKKYRVNYTADEKGFIYRDSTGQQIPKDGSILFQKLIE